MTDGVFTTYSRYCDLLYRDKDYPGEVAYIQRLLQRHGIAYGILLEFGSGTGKHGQHLAAARYQVHGIERSCDVVALQEIHPTRHSTILQIDLLAECYGFARIDAEELLTCNPPSESTWGVCVTLMRL